MSRLTRAWRNTRLYRRLAAERLPRLLIIGAQKAGTSALFSYLSQHPRFRPASEKEVDFFGSDLRFARGMDWYSARWEPAPPGPSVCFEASPQYLYLPKAAQRIRRCLPQVKLVAILRDPIARARSAWTMYRQQLASDPQFYENFYRARYTTEEVADLVPRTAAELDDFSLAVEREMSCLSRGHRMQMSILDLGLYGPQLQRYLAVFPREQLLVLDNHDLRNNRITTLNHVLDFLGMPIWDWSQSDLRDVFVGRSTEPISPRTSAILVEYFRESNGMLAKMLNDPPKFAVEDELRRASA